MFSGILNLPWWGDVVAGLILVQITIAAVTLYLHRCQAHSALELHPVVSHFFRFWLWLTTGMVTKEWAAIHRKHHAKCETADDPHSPRIYGINRVLFRGVMLYVKESHNAETSKRYGSGTPDDWIERHLYTPLTKWGVIVLAVLDLVLFGAIPGALIYGVQVAWIPFWAAGVINGLGHYFGYRNFQTDDDSTNIVPWAAWIGGEELHNNHHAYPTSAKFSLRWYEFDLGWMYIRILQSLGLAKVRRPVPKVKLDPSKFEVDAATLHAVIMHRYDVMAKYAKSIKRAATVELAKLGAGNQLAGTKAVRAVKKWLPRDAAVIPSKYRATVEQAVASSTTLQTTLAMRAELARLWERSTLNTEQLVAQLKEWCERAEKSGVAPLIEFSHRLRRYG